MVTISFKTRPGSIRRPAHSLLNGLTLLVGLATLSGGAQAIESPWYVGVGASAANLRPDAIAIEKAVDESSATGGTLFFGRDLDQRSSLQLQLHGLGYAVYDADAVVEEEKIGYTAADASVLYRLADTRARGAGGQGFGATLYARLAVGAIMRDTDLRLDNDNEVYLGAGAGIELHANNRLALRAEGFYFDRDVSAASLSLVARLGGRSSRWPAPPEAGQHASANTRTALPPLAVQRQADRSEAESSNLKLESATTSRSGTSPLSTPAGAGEARAVAGVEDNAAASGEPRPRTTSAAPREITLAASSGAGFVVTESAFDVAAADESDGDGDGIGDDTDACPRSNIGYPIRADGCPLLEGILSGVRFAPQSAALLPGASTQLDNLAKLMNDYPLARIELLAHTDDAGTVREQSIVTRARLKTLALYLVHDKGISANRVALRSLGGIRPLYENTTAEGRRRNNRVEIKENSSGG